MKNIIVKVNLMNTKEGVLIEQIEKSLPVLSCGWAGRVEEDFFKKILPVDGYTNGRAFYLEAYNVDDNRDMYRALLDLKNSGWTPDRIGFLRVYDHCGTWSVSRLGGKLTKIKVHRYKPDEVLTFDLKKSIEQFAHKKLTYEEIVQGSYDPLVRIK